MSNEKLLDLDAILNMWTKDTDIDSTNLKEEAIRTSKLHSKYLSIRTRHSLRIKKLHFDYLQLKVDKEAYYDGKMSQEDLKERGWNPYPHKLLKSAVELRIDSDKDIIDILKVKIYHEEIVSVCDSIIKELHSRTYAIGHSVAAQRLLMGA